MEIDDIEDGPPPRSKSAEADDEDDDRPRKSKRTGDDEEYDLPPHMRKSRSRDRDDRDRDGDDRRDRDRDDDPDPPRRKKKKKKKVLRSEWDVEPRTSYASGAGSHSIGREIIGGVLLMIVASVWLCAGLAADRLFIYPIIMFIGGVASVVKGLFGGGD